MVAPLKKYRPDCDIGLVGPTYLHIERSLTSRQNNENKNRDFPIAL